MSELVYPIYIDRDMIAAFLASLEGGILESIEISQSSLRSSDPSEPVKKPSAKFGDAEGNQDPYGLESSRLSDIDLSKSGTITFPEASLFIRLRNLLLANGDIKIISNSFDLKDLVVGDLIEFSAKFQTTPLQDLEKIMRIIPLFYEMDRRRKIVELDTQIGILEKVKPNEAIKIDGEVKKLDALTINYLRASLKAQKDNLSGGFSEENAMIDLLSRSMSSGASETLLGVTHDVKFLCRAYQKFAREGVFDDIYNCEWRVLGKVVGKVDNNGEYDILTGTALNVLPVGEIEKIFEDFSSASMNIDFSKTRLKGPIVSVAALGIFS